MDRFHYPPDSRWPFLYERGNDLFRSFLVRTQQKPNRDPYLGLPI